MGAVSRVLIALLALRFLIWAFRLRGTTRIVPAQAAKLGVRLSSRLSFFPPASPIVMPDLLHTSLSPASLPFLTLFLPPLSFLPSLSYYSLHLRSLCQAAISRVALAIGRAVSSQGRLPRLCRFIAAFYRNNTYLYVYHVCGRNF